MNVIYTIGFLKKGYPRNQYFICYRREKPLSLNELLVMENVR
ncbi:hypothetical protein SUNDANCE_65 [Brevibacillus phage Sundance]|nr:hypothetical protein AVT09_gp065 [Brevibacillus phage Sundance]ALA47881.1 hypothetical protein SUNDANCE_65 [Brevibacillus phage Sundance]